MAGRLVVLMCALLSVGGVAADDGGEPADIATAGTAGTVQTAGAVTTTAALRRTHPWIHGSMSTAVMQKLDVAIDIANDRVNRIPECARLFSQLGADASETLAAVLYLPVAPDQEDAACRHALAHTFVGDVRTWVCPGITHVSDSQAAMVLIHEALHHAGLSERRRDRRAKPSTDINEEVSFRCRL